MDIQDIEISEAFDLLDPSRCMAISTRDYKLAIKALGLELPRREYIQSISRMKRDQRGFIEKEIFMKEVRTLLSMKGFENDMIKAFRLIDDDDTGKIDFNNLKNVAVLLGEQVTDQEIINMLKVADSDGDGQVNLTEFMKLMDKAREIL